MFWSKFKSKSFSPHVIHQVADIHEKAFRGFFLTLLGKPFLRIFYGALLQDKSTIFYSWNKEGEILGFLFASTSPKGLYKKIFLKHIFRFSIQLFFVFSKRISLLGRLIKSYSAGKLINPRVGYAALLSIAVSPDYSGRGIGKLLLIKLEKDLIKHGINGYYLTTDANNNYATNQFYLNFGFKLNGSYSQGKRLMNIYVKDLK